MTRHAHKPGKPRVTATHTEGGEDVSSMTTREHLPRVDLTVEFDHGDQDQALALLDRAIADVRAQIGATR